MRIASSFIIIMAALPGCRSGDVSIQGDAVVVVASATAPLVPPTPAPTATAGALLPDPTTAPLPAPLAAEQALHAALELDRYIVSRMPLTPEELTAKAIVRQYDGRAEADAALGLQSGYAEEIEADAGQVWLISLPGPVWNVIGPGLSSSAVYDGIAYQFSSRTGQFLGVTTGPSITLGAMAVSTSTASAGNGRATAAMKSTSLVARSKFPRAREPSR